MKNNFVKKVLVLFIVSFQAFVFVGNTAVVNAAVEITVQPCIDQNGRQVDCNSGNRSSGNISGTGDLSYTPLEPVPGAPQSGDTDLAELVQWIFRILFSLSALLAVGMLAAGGIEYMVSEVAHRKSEGLKRAQAAIYGILILAGSWLILNTINPDLLEFNFNPGSATFNQRFNGAAGSGGAANQPSMQLKATQCESIGEYYTVHKNPDGSVSCYKQQ